MYHSNFPAFHRLVKKIRKLHYRLASISREDATSPKHVKQALYKRYQSYLRKLPVLLKPAYATGVIMSSIIALPVSVPAQKQPCSNFHSSPHSDPVHRIPLPAGRPGKPSFVDIDGDGDLDCYAENYDSFGSTNRGYVFFLRNNGTKDIPYFQRDSASGFPSTLKLDLGVFPFSIDGPLFADMDGDGDYDCLIGSYLPCCNQSIVYFENTGTRTQPAFTERDGTDNPFSLVNGYYGLSYALADLDSDGDFDLITTRYSYTTIYTNTGTFKKPVFQKTQSTREAFSGHLCAYDWNHDGLIDYFNSGAYYKNTGTPQSPVFTPSFKEGANVPGYLYRFTDLNNDGFPETFDLDANFATTSPDAYIKMDSTKKRLEAYPKQDSSVYKWQRNGKAIPGATRNHFTPKQPGYYTVEVTNTCGTTVSYPYVYKSKNASLTGDDEKNAAMISLPANRPALLTGITAYPNPFTTSFVMQLNDDADLSKITIRITDIQGRTVEVIKPNSYTFHGGEKLVKGMYLVQLMKGSEVMYEQKVMKK